MFVIRLTEKTERAAENKAPCLCASSLWEMTNGRLEKILLFRSEEDKRWVFRLWPTNIQFKDTGEPLWVGTVEIQDAFRLADLITLPQERGDYSRPLEILSQTLKRAFRLREVYRKGDDIHGKDKPDALVWNGQVLLVRETIG